MPMLEGLNLTHNLLIGAGIRDQVQLRALQSCPPASPVLLVSVLLRRKSTAFRMARERGACRTLIQP